MCVWLSLGVNLDASKTQMQGALGIRSVKISLVLVMQLNNAMRNGMGFTAKTSAIRWLNLGVNLGDSNTHGFLNKPMPSPGLGCRHSQNIIDLKIIV